MGGYKKFDDSDSDDPQSQLSTDSTDKYNSIPLSDRSSIEQLKPGFCERLYPAGFTPELKQLLKISFPIIFTQTFQYMIGPVALMFCGHLGEIELASVALAISFINITCVTIALGLSTACDTLFAQVYGSKNRRKLGTELQRSILVLLLAVFPCWAIFLNMEAILRLFGQDPFVSRIAARYMLIFMPAVPIVFLYMPLYKYIQNQNIVLPNLLIGGIANVLNAILHYVLVYAADMGTDGSAVSQVLAYLTMLVLTMFYIYYYNITKDTWTGWSTECLLEWASFVRLATFGTITLCIEYWAFEIGTICAGLLGTQYLSAMSVMFQLETFFYMLPLGTGIAASVRVGQFLGAGDADGAKTAARVALTAVTVAQVCLAILILLLRPYLPYIFTDVPEVVELVQGVLVLNALFQLCDGLEGTGAGILRGQGRQTFGAIIAFLGFGTGLALGTPLMLYTPLTIYAFWGGLAIALSVEGISLACIINFANWEKLAVQAQIRTRVMSTSEMSNQVLLDGLGEMERLSLTEEKGSNINDDSFSSADDTNLISSVPKSVFINRMLALFVMILILVAGILIKVFYTDKLVLPAVSLATAGNFTTSAPPGVENGTTIDSLTTGYTVS